ncbi:hypothetical protein NLU13_3769 [Sarocladium strictum]|uniref:Cyclin-D1-binding protein 1-like N-terminal domain-containing protein n=1 Tax=Sarocladium strictum TaxID=5046 RepID=A0AA39GJ13_SARSR|nr:hypothetical protein NLU13_3769 [Sarocladium strictum]
MRADFRPSRHAVWKPRSILHVSGPVALKMATPHSDPVQSLNALVDSALTLVQQLKGALADIQRGSASGAQGSDSTSRRDGEPAEPVDALQLAKDAAALIKAHATKLSLLIITEPLTPSAISTVVRELVAGPLAALATAVELCTPGSYTKDFQHELLWRSQGVYTGLVDLLQKIPRNGQVLVGSAKNGSAGGKGSLTSTGVLWSACDGVVELADQGLRGFYVHKIGEWKGTIRDVAEELKEWGEEEPEEDEEEGASSDTEQAGSPSTSGPSAQEMVDDFMGSSGTIPRDDPDGIRPRLESAVRCLRLTVILCMAIDKRRMKKLPSSMPTKSIVTRLSEASEQLRQLPEDFGDLAAAFYELDPEEIDETMERCCSRAVAIGETLNLGWDGETDEFTEWMLKFRSEMRKT